jgi:hypothetical protein
LTLVDVKRMKLAFYSHLNNVAPDCILIIAGFLRFPDILSLRLSSIRMCRLLEKLVLYKFIPESKFHTAEGWIRLWNVFPFGIRKLDITRLCFPLLAGNLKSFSLKRFGYTKSGENAVNHNQYVDMEKLGKDSYMMLQTLPWRNQKVCQTLNVLKFDAYNDPSINYTKLLCFVNLHTIILRDYHQESLLILLLVLSDHNRSRSNYTGLVNLVLNCTEPYEDGECVNLVSDANSFGFGKGKIQLSTLKSLLIDGKTLHLRTESIFSNLNTTIAELFPNLTAFRMECHTTTSVYDDILIFPEFLTYDPFWQLPHSNLK